MAAPDQHHAPFRNRLLAALPPEDRERLRPRLQPVELTLDKTVQAADAPVEAVLFPESGMVSLLATLGDGERIEVGIAGREGLVGLPLVFGSDRSPTEAKVQVEGTALRIGAAAFRAAMGESAAVRDLLLRYALAFYAQVTATAACNTIHPMGERLARWLLIAHDRADGDEFSMTHEAMALMLGVRRPGVSLAAGARQRAGLIRYVRGRIEVVDRPGLEAASCECYGAARREHALLLNGYGAAPPI